MIVTANKFNNPYYSSTPIRTVRGQDATKPATSIGFKSTSNLMNNGVAYALPGVLGGMYLFAYAKVMQFIGNNQSTNQKSLINLESTESKQLQKIVNSSSKAIKNLRA